MIYLYHVCHPSLVLIVTALHALSANCIYHISSKSRHSEILFKALFDAVTIRGWLDFEGGHVAVSMLAPSILLGFLMKFDRWRDTDALRSCYTQTLSHLFCISEVVIVSQTWLGQLSDHIPS